jgi:hypothetical protein
MHFGKEILFRFARMLYQMVYANAIRRTAVHY